MLTHTITAQGLGNVIAIHLVTVIAVYAVLMFATLRLWLKPNEMPIVGAAVIFWAIGWMLSPVIPVVRFRYPELSTAIPLSLAMIAPLIVAMVIGAVFVRKRAIATEARAGHSGDNANPPKAATPSRKKR